MLNDELDAELFEELLREKYLVEEEIKQDWFELDSPITGGDMANNIKRLRENGELIKTLVLDRKWQKHIPVQFLFARLELVVHQ